MRWQKCSVGMVLCGLLAAAMAGCDKKIEPAVKEDPNFNPVQDPTLFYLREAIASRSSKAEAYGGVRKMLPDAQKRELVNLIGFAWKSFEPQPDSPIKTAVKPETGVNVYYPVDANENLKQREIDVQVVVYRDAAPEPLLVHIGIYTGPFRSFYLLKGPAGEPIERFLLEQTKK